MQRNHLFIKAAGLHCYRRTTCRDTEREMNRSALRNMLKVVGIIMVVMLPVMLALWFAQLRAVSEISAQLRTFAELALNKTERVIQQVDLAREDAEKYQGKVCTPEHRQYMLNVSRGRLFVASPPNALFAAVVVRPRAARDRGLASLADQRRGRHLVGRHRRVPPEAGVAVLAVGAVSQAALRAGDGIATGRVIGRLGRRYRSVARYRESLARRDDLGFGGDQRSVLLAAASAGHRAAAVFARRRCDALPTRAAARMGALAHQPSVAALFARHLLDPIVVPSGCLGGGS